VSAVVLPHTPARSKNAGQQVAVGRKNRVDLHIMRKYSPGGWQPGCPFLRGSMRCMLLDYLHDSVVPPLKQDAH